MLDINPILLVITLAMFICLIRYLDKRLYQPLLKYMEDRENMFQGDQASVNQNYSDIDALNREAESILANARQEATSIKEAVISEAKEAIAQKLEEKKKELATSYHEFEKGLAQERISLKNHLLADSSSIESSLKERFTLI